MKIVILSVGRTRPPFAEAIGHYQRLLRGRLPLELAEVKTDATLIGRVPAEAHAVAIDAAGRTMNSEAWATWLNDRRVDARDLYLMIGGAEGLSAQARERAAESLSLGPQTMAHQLARVVLLEQLFRASKITAGEPYHL